MHELRQPIAATLANVAAARRFLRQPEPNVGEALAALENIHRDEQRAAQLVERFRCLLKEPSPSSDCCDLNETIRAVVDLVRGEATQRAIDLRCDLAFGLPPIAADAGQLEQLLLNLVLNAFDAVGDPEWISRAVTIRTRYDNGGKLTLVMVEDAGPPVPDEVIERMTTPLYTTKPDGLGLGLAICREILAAHGSELLIARGDSGGMVFSFKLRTVVDGREAEIAVRPTAQ